MSIIEIENVSKKFLLNGKEFYALKNINLEIEKGEIFALLGPNGAGKTTLINCMTNLLIPDSGKIRLLGEEVTTEIIEQINVVSGETRFHEALQPNDILNFYGKLYGLKKNELEKTIKTLLKFFGIEHLAKSRFSSLSTGERMRLIFAKALLNKPKILLLDEPTLGLDPNFSTSLRKEIKRINKKYKTTILLTSHYMPEVQELSDRVAFIHKGKIIDITKTKNIKSKYSSMEDYFIKMSTRKKKWNGIN